MIRDDFVIFREDSRGSVMICEDSRAFVLIHEDSL
jgi:hypothetical protein